MTKTILVADDDQPIADALKLMLELDGYQVSITHDGGIIYRMTEKWPDLLLLDIWMSGQDGRDICKYLKQNPATNKIPIILISASRDVEISAKQAGADDFIAKPFEMDELLAKVKKHLDDKI